ncbi:MAG: extracellular solute-binding protein [Deltaproteobacteria bacterium]|nr:extracellular solute-binding protein [Deltaproteobacteria bacterium]
MQKKLITIFFFILILSANSAPAVTIEFWTTETQSDRIKTIELLMDTFQALNPEITVKLIPVDENDLPPQVAAAVAAGNLPHIIEVGSELTIAFGEEGILDIPLTSQIINRIGQKRFYKGALKMLSAPEEGKYYGLPYHGWVQGIWYRKDWFKEKNLNPPDTWENILKAAKALHKPEDNRYGILVGTKPEVYTEQCFTHFALSNGVSEFNIKGELVFNSPETLETLKFYRQLAEFNPPGPQSWRARDYYLQGKMAMFFYSTYIMDDLALAEIAAGSLTSDHFSELKGGAFDPELVKNTGVVPIIKGKKPAGYGSIIGLGIIKKQSEKEKNAVKKLVEFMYEPYSYITFLHMAPGGMNPVLRDIATMPEYLNDPKGIFKRYGSEKVAAVIEGLDSIGSFTSVNGRSFPQSGKIYSKMIIPQMIYSVTIEGKSPEEALERATNEMKKVLKE